MTGAGASTGGGLCSRSITDLATSAAERIVSAGFGARGLALRVFGAGGTAPAADLRAGVRGALRTGGLALVAAALDARFCAAAVAAVAAVAAASTFRRACFAAFFSALNALRACLSSALADRTCSFAPAARAAALAAAASNRCIVAGLPAMIDLTTACEIKIP